MNFSSNNLKKHVEVILLNKRIFLILFFSFMFLAFVEKQELDESQRESVYEFINCFKDDDGKEKLAALVHFPLKRRYPLPDINNAKEFLERIDDMFDEKLIQMIVKSDIDEDWSIVGFRGIMLHHGVLWLGLDGKLISVNYQSEVEEKKKNEIVQSDRKNLHRSLKVFENPVLHWETEKYRIRIDELRDSKYRYAVWPVSKPQSDKPDLILNNGTKSFEGSGGNHSYHFTSGSYRYSCYVEILGFDDTPGCLVVYKNGEEILSEKVINVIKEN